MQFQLPNGFVNILKKQKQPEKMKMYPQTVASKHIIIGFERVPWNENTGSLTGFVQTWKTPVLPWRCLRSWLHNLITQSRNGECVRRRRRINWCVQCNDW